MLGSRQNPHGRVPEDADMLFSSDPDFFTKKNNFRAFHLSSRNFLPKAESEINCLCRKSSVVCLFTFFSKWMSFQKILGLVLKNLLMRNKKGLVIFKIFLIHC